MVNTTTNLEASLLLEENFLVLPTKYYTVLDFVEQTFGGIGGIRVKSLYDLKNYDLIRELNTAILWVDSFDQEYIGFGNESWGVYNVGADVYLLGVNTNAILDEVIRQVHYYVANYSARGQTIEDDKIVWYKLLNEENRQSDFRGATLYHFDFEVRVYVVELGSRYGIIEE
ncbi:MAG: hypothetical protein QXL94_08680, partial [Candidatus Parvarchaeum sp.]